MSVYDEYAKQLEEDARLQKESVDVSTKAQLDALAENKKLIEAEKQNAMRGAYVDYAKNINPYGVQSELAYASGLGGAGKGETAHANYYGSYQRRLGDINTAATEQLRGIAQQEASARLAGDQAKLGIDSQLNQQKADAQREDRTNAYNQLLAAIGNTGYTPTDAELQYAGMTRELANSYRTAYQQSLSSKSGGNGTTDKPITTSLENVDIIRSNLAAFRDGGNTTAMGKYLDQLVAAKAISEELADALFAEYVVRGTVRPGQGRSAQNQLYDETIKAAISG
jgi:hypothetical protein